MEISNEHLQKQARIIVSEKVNKGTSQLFDKCVSVYNAMVLTRLLSYMEEFAATLDYDLKFVCFFDLLKVESNED